MDLLEKTVRLKDFAVKNGFDVDPAAIRTLNELSFKYSTPPGKESQPKASKDLAADSNKLDDAIEKLTALTYPTTIDLPKEKDLREYNTFKGWLWKIAIAALLLAIAGFVLSVKGSPSWQAIGNSTLAMFLGLLGAVTYSLFNVLRVLPPQAFNPTDGYYNFARLLLGMLLGWVFYFAFAMPAFRELPNYFTVGGKPQGGAYKLLVPFLAGYSTKFVVGVLERAMVALEVSLGIEEKRDVRAKRVVSRRSAQ